MRSLAFIGAGTVGSALAISLRKVGYPVAAVASRTPASAQRLADQLPGSVACDTLQAAAASADLVFLTVPDDAIAAVAISIVWQPGQAAIHCSGSLSLDVLDAARAQGATAGAIHPLQTFASVENAIQNLPGSTFALEAEDRGLMAELEGMAEALGGHWIHLGPGEKVLYHASAVLACNYFVTLVKLATDLWQGFGVPREDAVRALMPLLRGTLSNIENVGLPDCLTGPIARGDVGTVQKHLAALEAVDPDILAAYRCLGSRTVPIAEAKGRLTPEAAGRLREILAAAGPDNNHSDAHTARTGRVPDETHRTEG